MKNAIKEKINRISQEDVPAYPLEEALRISQALFDHFGKTLPLPIHVAAALKLAPGGSQFKMLTGAAIAYGLTNGGYNAASMTLTPLARRILSPESEGDDVVAKREAFMRPRVIKEFVSKYDGSPIPREDIAINVLAGMGVPRERAASIFASIIKTAEELKLTQEIKAKKYFVLQSIASVPESRDDESESHPDLIAPLLTDTPRIGHVVSLPTKAPSTPNGNSVATDPRTKRVFITHGKNHAFVDPIKKLLQFGEMEAVVSVEKQSVSEPVPEKVMNDMRSCGAAIIHVESEQKVIDSEAKEHTILNSNVLIEIGAAMALYGHRFILLVKDGVKLPSNLQGLYEVRYNRETLDGNTTIKLLESINELKKRPLVPATVSFSTN